MHQDATYWPPGANDGLGSLALGNPVSIKCRWQDAQELFRDAAGNEVTSSAVVYVDRELEVKGFLYLGVSAVADPRGSLDAREIRQRASSPDLRAQRVLNKVYL
jgi:hypothetical protein